MNKHFEVCLLINISIFWTPSVFWMVRFSSINTWLRINSEQFICVQWQENLTDISCLKGDASFWEWELLDLSLEVLDKNGWDIFHGSALLSPHLSLLNCVNILKLFAVGHKSVIIVECWRSTVTPSSIWILIPSLGFFNVACWFIWPENWSNVFVLSFSWISLER